MAVKHGLDDGTQLFGQQDIVSANDLGTTDETDGNGPQAADIASGNRGIQEFADKSFARHPQ
jgi:hypothetical protein